MWDVSYKIVTPMFLGGANPDKNENLKVRIPSIKGVLRFWYRAIALERLGSVEEVRIREARLFGSADKGQGAFLLRVCTEKGKSLAGKDKFRMGLNYLGYGLHKRGEPHFMKKPFINPGTIIDLKFYFKENLADAYKIMEDDLNDLKLAIKALGFFGGLGARSRRGFGSLALLSIKENGDEIWRAPATRQGLEENYVDFFRELKLKPRSEELPEYTAFTTHSRCVVGMENDDVLDLLNQIGTSLNDFRTYKKENPNFSDDHDLVFNVINHSKPTHHPRRVVFGLPHNYYFSSLGKSASVVGIDRQNEYRRATPLFIHVHQVGDKHVGVFLFLPSNFLPDKVDITIYTSKSQSYQNRVSSTVKTMANFTPITEFLNEIEQLDGVREVEVNA